MPAEAALVVQLQGGLELLLARAREERKEREELEVGAPPGELRGPFRALFAQVRCMCMNYPSGPEPSSCLGVMPRVCMYMRVCMYPSF